MPDSEIKPLVVLNVVGLTSDMLGPNTPHLSGLAARGFARPLGTVLPAVTCSAQATMLTGRTPREHGVVGNGWYDRSYAEVVFWKQSNHLIGAPKVYATARQRNAAHTTCKLFWWFNMYSQAEWSVTPRPSYPADGRKVFDSYSRPPELRDELQSTLGVFPLLRFWGPGADITSSRWIADATREMLRTKRPSLTLVYLPHLDYDLQRLGPDDAKIPEAIREIDAEVGRIVEVADEIRATILVVSEYGITQVDRPVHLNRHLREAGLLTVRREPLGWETLDAGASRAFAVADHQVAHVYVQNPDDIAQTKTLLESIDGVERVLTREQQAEFGIDHARAGDLVAVAADGAWFTYYFWFDDDLAPDYARTVDIHRKPGYDPCELFIDPEIRLPKLRLARRLLRKKLGFRYYMDLTPLDASLVKGSHGRLPEPSRVESEAPVLICTDPRVERNAFELADVHDLILDLNFGT